MGVIVQSETTINPITLMGKEAGICWGGNVTHPEKNYDRGLDCLKSGHMRTAEFPQVFLVLDGYSARVIRELYTHIGGMPTRLQASTRYIDYKNFQYIIPPSISKNAGATLLYTSAMADIQEALGTLAELGLPKEDIANLLPLGMTTRVVLRTNLRNLIDMAHQRLCTRAYWEFRMLMNDIIEALREYSDEWKALIDIYHVFKPKCEVCGFCEEKFTCGRRPRKEEISKKFIAEVKVDLQDEIKKVLQKIDSEKVRTFLEQLIDKD